MKELILQMAQEMATGKLSEQAAKSKLAAVSKDSQLWDEIIQQIRELELINGRQAYYLAILACYWAEQTMEEPLLYQATLCKGRAALTFPDFDIARACFSACQEHYRQIGRNDLLYQCYLEYGDGYASIDRMAKALEYYKEMLKIAEPVNRDEWKAQALFKIGSMNNKLGKVEDAISAYEKAFEHAAACGDELLAAKISASSLKLFQEFEEVGQKLEYYEKLIAFFSEKGNVVEHAQVLMAMASVISGEGYREKAIECLEKALHLVDPIPDYNEKSDLLTQIGNLYREEGHFSHAIEYFERARNSLRQSEPKPKTDTRAASPIPHPISSDNRPPIHPEDEKELANCQDLVKQARQEGNLPQQAVRIHELGNIYFRLEKLEQAMQCWHESRDLAEQLEDMELKYENCFRLGLLSVRRGDIESARTAFSQGIQILEEMKDYQIPPSFEFVADKVEIFHRTISCCVAMGNLATALHFLEELKRWLFFARVNDRALLARANISDDIKNEYIGVLEKLRRTYADLRKQEEEALPVAMLSALREYKSQLDETRTQIEVLDPDWAVLFGRQYQFDPVTLQQSLAEGTMLLEFLVGEEGTFIFLADRQHLDVISISEITRQWLQELYQPFAEIDKFEHLWQDWCIECQLGDEDTQEKLSEKLIRFNWRHPFECKKAWQTHLDTAMTRLAQTLLPQLMMKLEDYCTERLILIPGQALQLFPLHLLPLRELEDSDAVLQDRYEIVYWPSSLLYLLCRNRAYQQDNKMLLIDHNGDNFHFFTEEIRMLQNIWHGEVVSLKEQQANAENLSEHASNCSYIHFGGYSTSSFPDPLNSVLHLCGEEKNSLDEYRISGLLSRLFLSAQVVSLGGNESEIGKFDNCGDIMALPNALIYAGAQAVVLSLWSVPDLVAFFLFEKFYHGLAQGLRAAMALQEAQNELRQLTVADICQRLKQQQKLLPEAQSQWLKDLLSLLEGQGDSLPTERQQELVAMLIACREPVMGGMEDLNALELKHFFFPGPQSDVPIKTVLQAIDFNKPDSCPFHHPFYWGGFFCSGLALTRIAARSDDDEDSIKAIYVDELGVTSDGESAAKDIQNALTNLTEDGFKAYETVASLAKQNPVLMGKVKQKRQETRARCPECNKKFRCILPSSGGKTRCPHCNKRIRIPARRSPFDDVKIMAICPHCTTNIHCFLPMAGRRAQCPRCQKRVRVPSRDILLAEIAAGDPSSRLLLLDD